MVNPYRAVIALDVPLKRSRQERYAIALRQIRRALKRAHLTKRAYNRLLRLEARAEAASMAYTRNERELAVIVQSFGLWRRSAR